MTFGDVALDAAMGATLAHSIQLQKRRLRKGTSLTQADIEDLRAAGHDTVTVAVLAPSDLDEDTAAAHLAQALVQDGLSHQTPFTGRANLHAEAAGVLRIDSAVINAFNEVDPGITIATLADYARVTPRQMIATVKIIPYGVAKSAVQSALRLISDGPMRLHPFRHMTAQLIVTRLDGQKESLVTKGIEAVRNRLDALSITLLEPQIVPHDTQSVAQALGQQNADIKLILGASATSDERDVCPAALTQAGGALTRFGMPVDPGNLLFLGDLSSTPVIGLPGCARSPALNGADWVLERIAAGLDVTNADISAMGVGGLLKEIATRPQPRMGNARAPKRPHVAIILLAAGASRRMRGKDKLLEPVDGAPLIQHAAQHALAANVDDVLVVLDQSKNSARHKALAPIGNVKTVHALQAKDGMAASLRAGMAALDPKTDAVIVALADMPDVSAVHYNRLIAAFDPSEGRSIARAMAQDGTAGHPVLFGKRFFENLSSLEGDQGAKALIKASKDYLVEVPTPGMGAITDLDTPQAWAAWRAAKS